MGARREAPASRGVGSASRHRSRRAVGLPATSRGNRLVDLATLTLRVDSSGAIRSVEGLNKALGANVKEATKAEKAMSAVGTAAKLGLAAGMTAGALAIRKMVRESSEAQKVQAQLAAGLRSTA